MQEYKSNSFKSKEAEASEKKVARVVSGPVEKKKESEWSKVIHSFVQKDAGEIAHYIFYDAIIPAIKRTVLESLEMVFYGETKKRRVDSTNGKERPYRSYEKCFNNEESVRIKRGGYSYDGLQFPNRGDAEETLDSMLEILEDQGAVSVGQLYDLVGITSDFTDYNYGWKNISDPRILRNRDGSYEIKLSKPVPIT